MRLRRLGGAAVPAFAAAAVFSLAPAAVFLQWDDAANLLSHDRWRGVGLGNLRWMWTTRHYGPWQPLSWLSWAVDFSLWGLDPAALRRTNVLLHAAAAGLLAHAARRALESLAPRLKPASRELGALTCALLFALHPLRVESVVWLTERRDVLSGAFAMGSILAWLARRRGLSAALLGAALLSKGTAVAVLPFLFALDAAGRRRRPAETARALLPHAALAAAAAIMNLSGFASGDLRAPEIGVLDRLLLAGSSAWFYLVKSLVPVGLSPYYALPLDLSGARPSLAAGAAASAAVTALAFHPSIRRWAAPAWLAFLAALAPVSGLLQNGRQLAADRYSYLPALPFALLAGLGFARLAERRPRSAAVLLALLALSLSALTVRQSRYWASDASLWSRAVALDPGAYLPRSNLAQALLAAGRGEEAAPHFAAAIALEPRDVEARVNLGVILESRGDAAGAERLYREALALRPGDREAAVNLAVVRANRGGLAEAEALLLDVLQRDPGFAPARRNLDVLRRMRRR